ncbi:uncharacterized protein LOC123988424 [Osmia bicornis bicornis]|uniref:uncharacterized protein LOC123988424 n=1 Tax=Osmia bicornis bicornis TaxID=1437191 RepID=UPI001EAF76FB|nr:uncharacterized protein LOC123988424 [Osmia bicornis bicornis]
MPESVTPKSAVKKDAITRDTSTMDTRQEVEAHEFRNVKLPAFWKDEPRLWFKMLEREFTAYNVKADAVKSSAVVRNLDPATMKIILDVIEAPEEKSTYVHIKQALIERLAKSDEANLRKLLTDLELGNKKSSELLREMSQLTGKNVGESVFWTLWIQRLPTRVQEVLAIVVDADLDRLAKLADKISERSGVAEVAAISDSNHGTRESRKDTMPGRQHGDLAAIAQRLEHLEARLTGRYRSGSGSRRRFYRRRSGSRSKEVSRDNGYCYVHGRFGEESWRCRKPCSCTGPDKRRPEK